MPPTSSTPAPTVILGATLAVAPATLDPRTFQRNRQVIARRLPDRTVLLNGTTGACYELNGVGSAIWEELDGTRSWAAIAGQVALRFGLAEAAATADVARFAAALTAANLVEPVSP